MTARLFLPVAFIFLTACGAIRPRPDAGTQFTIEHGGSKFQNAMDGAQQHCAKLGMHARHLGSDPSIDFLGTVLLSRFECVAA